MILPTRRVVTIAACLAPLALLGYVGPWGLDVLLAADAALLILAYLDARLAPDPRHLELQREAPASLSMGRAGIINYRWRNPEGRAARLVVRETWPAIGGGPRPARVVTIPGHGTATESIDVTATRRGRERGGMDGTAQRGPAGPGAAATAARAVVGCHRLPRPPRVQAPRRDRPGGAALRRASDRSGGGAKGARSRACASGFPATTPAPSTGRPRRDGGR